MKSTVLYRRMCKNFLLFVLIVLTQNAVQAQSNSQFIQRYNIGSFGTSYSTSRVYISHTAGQSSGFTQEVSGGVELRQGFEQALQFIGKQETRTVRMVVYPNPNNGLFFIKTDLPRGTRFVLTVFDLHSKFILSGEGEGGTESRFELPWCIAPGTYPAVLQTADGLKAETKIVIL